jgi:sugar phosphate isomerase/epimerase
MSALGPEDLVLCSGTLIEASFRDMIDAASAAGFQAVSLWVEDVERARDEGLSPAEAKAYIEDRGLAVAELDPLLSWLGHGTLGEGAAEGADAMLGRGEEAFYAIADAIGGTALNCAHPFPGPVDLDRAAEAFAGVCDRAAEHGLDAVIEFLPWTEIGDVATAADVVVRAGRANGGVMLDTWHYFRGSSNAEQLRGLPGELIKAVQISSAPREPQGNPMQEAMGGRLLPGEGAIDIAEIVRILDEIGSAAPIGVEVFSKRLDALPAKDAAQRCYDATRKELTRARG